jgi:N-acyl-L-homoserine lactone synthetase
LWRGLGPHYSDFGYDASQRFACFVSLIQKLLPGLLKDGTLIPGLHQDEKTASEVLEARAYAVVSSATLQMHAKRFIISRTKLAGLAPRAAEEGDQIVILLGCDFPVVMRNMGSYWTLIGEIYVDKIMYGEAMDGLVSGKYTERSFKIW